MAGNALDVGFAYALGGGGRRDKSGAQAVGGKVAGDPGLRYDALDQSRHVFRVDPMRREFAGERERAKDRPFGDRGGIEPRPHRPHRAQPLVCDVGDTNLAALAGLVGLRAAQRDDQAPAIEAQVGHVERRDLRAPRGAGEGEQQQRAIAPDLERIADERQERVPQAVGGQRVFLALRDALGAGDALENRLHLRMRDRVLLLGVFVRLRDRDHAPANRGDRLRTGERRGVERHQRRRSGQAARVLRGGEGSEVPSVGGVGFARGRRRGGLGVGARLLDGRGQRRMCGRGEGDERGHAASWYVSDKGNVIGHVPAYHEHADNATGSQVQRLSSAGGIRPCAVQTLGAGNPGVLHRALGLRPTVNGETSQTAQRLRILACLRATKEQSRLHQTLGRCPSGRFSSLDR